MRHLLPARSAISDSLCAEFRGQDHHLATRSHAGGGGVTPIRVRACRIASAEVIAPCRQSTSVNIFSSLGIAIFARGPRFPRDVATQKRTDSSEMSRRDTRSLKTLWCTFFGSRIPTKLVCFEERRSSFNDSLRKPLAADSGRRHSTQCPQRACLEDWSVGERQSPFA